MRKAHLGCGLGTHLHRCPTLCPLPCVPNSSSLFLFIIPFILLKIAAPQKQAAEIMPSLLPAVIGPGTLIAQDGEALDVW
ncbi:hypothetical protein, partial [Dictyobacter arantiisoli]|uniref:hypothetical protein n=1 Tax=Dictyobacter arantiisoli TaxID=2014874 RepID=UPI001C0EB15C